MYVVYILLCSDNTFYIGSTTDISRRVNEHNNLKSGAKYTKARRPVALVYQEQVDSISTARSREAVLKKLSRREKELLVSRSIIPL
ncbi:MAG: GIY-YIG nuclease family protein [Candidatus Levybacteria bacterium]|nr:GIY-YIG nuclease family protein [Candidatus Levybacteria bacterium]